MLIQSTTEHRLAKLNSPHGLCTNIAHGSTENAARIKLILDIYLAYVNNAGAPLQYADRTGAIWYPCEELPTDFNSYRYRIAR